MATILVAARSATISMALRRQGFDVEDWLEWRQGSDAVHRLRLSASPSSALDAVVLDLPSDIIDVHAWLARVREGRPDLPLVVLGDRLMCEEVLPDRHDLMLAVPPISAVDVAALIRGAIERPALVEPAPVEPAPIKFVRDMAPVLPTDLGRPVPEHVETPRQAIDLTESQPSVPAQSSSLVVAPAASVASIAATLEGRGVLPAPRRRARWRSTMNRAMPKASRNTCPTIDEQVFERMMHRTLDGMSLQVLVDGLEECLSTVPSVTGLAEVMIDAALVDCGGDGGVVLLREPVGWVVAAGYGLRPLEYRARLDDEHWVVTSAASLGSLLRIDDTDVARQRLIGFPLASRRRLMVAAVGDHQALLVVARDNEAFSDADVKALTELAKEGRLHLDDSLRLRRLARDLEPFDRLPTEAL